MPGAERGPGKYDTECTEVLLSTGAQVVLLIVVGGSKGSGFSLNSVSPGHEAKVPTLLRELADMIEGVT